MEEVSTVTIPLREFTYLKKELKTLQESEAGLLKTKLSILEERLEFLQDTIKVRTSLYEGARKEFLSLDAELWLLKSELNRRFLLGLVLGLFLSMIILWV